MHLISVCEVLVGSGEGRVAVGGDEQPLSFHSNTLTQSVSMATDNSISRSEGSYHAEDFFFFAKTMTVKQ